MDEAGSFDTTDFSADVKRKFKYIITASLPADEQTELDQIIAEMGQIYSKAKVCVNIV